MKAIRVHEHGEAEALRYEDVPQPEPGAGQARVKVEAAGLNFIDVYHRKGLYPGQLPLTPGVEGAGVVDAVGPDTADFRQGDRVVWTGQIGSYADYNIVPIEKLVSVPEAISTQTAAAAMLQGLTAHYLALSTYPIKPGDVALVHAAAGGVGLLLVQIAKRQGARVIGTVSTEEKAALAKEMGADEVILYTQSDFEAETKSLTDGNGVDVVYESVGKDTFDKSLNCLKLRGYLVLYGQSSGPVPPMDPQTLNAKGSLFLTRPSLFHYIAERSDLMRRVEDLHTWILNGELNVRIDQTFPLEQAPDAHRYLEDRKTKGKVILIP